MHIGIDYFKKRWSQLKWAKIFQETDCPIRCKFIAFRTVGNIKHIYIRLLSSNYVSAKDKLESDWCTFMMTHVDQYHMSRDMRFPTMWYVRQAKPQISLRIGAV